ncbi:MAG: TM2 domain-containing protein [Verrucomicrobiales bacterium]|nr:TM2 domain-containing protein [Verrucomicrobiales bacterium]
MNTPPSSSDTHRKTVGYLLWIFGFTGSHRFYFGKPITGLIWLFTGGFFLIGWLVDLFLIPRMDRQADRRFAEGPVDYSIAWVLQTLPATGPLGLSRFYMGKWGTGLLYLLTGGLFLIGWAYDFCTLNQQVDAVNRQSRADAGSGLDLGTCPALPAA